MRILRESEGLVELTCPSCWDDERPVKRNRFCKTCHGFGFIVVVLDDAPPCRCCGDVCSSQLEGLDTNGGVPWPLCSGCDPALDEIGSPICACREARGDANWETPEAFSAGGIEDLFGAGRLERLFQAGAAS